MVPKEKAEKNGHCRDRTILLRFIEKINTLVFQLDLLPLPQSQG
jgi:hypothetical protein